jgi:hypothetical protein
VAATRRSRWVRREMAVPARANLMAALAATSTPIGGVVEVA